MHMLSTEPRTHARVHADTHTHTQSKAKPVAAIYTVMPTQTSWDTCALSRHSESVQENPPGGETDIPHRGCTCLTDDGVGTQSPT